MKIYNKIVLDIKTGDLLESDSFDYDGAIAHLFGGSPKSQTSTSTTTP
jgi:hypothetical protein